MIVLGNVLLVLPKWDFKWKKSSFHGQKGLAQSFPKSVDFLAAGLLRSFNGNYPL